MNRHFIIGNLTADPELRSTPAGKSVCTFTVAVNRRGGTEQQTDYMRVTAWGALGESCARYLTKGRKVAVVGSTSASAYVAKNGQARAIIEINAAEVEFLSPAHADSTPQQSSSYHQQPQSYGNQSGYTTAVSKTPATDGFSPVDDDDLPF